MYEEQKTENKPLVIPGYPCKTCKALTFYGEQGVDDCKKGTMIWYGNSGDPEMRRITQLNGANVSAYVCPIYIVAEDRVHGKQPIIFTEATLDEDVFKELIGYDEHRDEFDQYRMQFALGGVHFVKTI